MRLISGGHSILYSKDADADRQFLKEVFGFPSVDAGGGWLIFGLPPSELAVHPSSRNSHFEFYLMSDNIKALTSDLRKKGIRCSPIQVHSWGLLTRISLPGGGKLQAYEPRHPRPKSPRSVLRRTTQQKATR